MMTTVAKIGYGDYYPISASEKAMCTIVLIIAVIYFSWVLDQFIELWMIDPSPQAIYRESNLLKERIKLKSWLQ
jgi:hypothetical protein